MKYKCKEFLVAQHCSLLNSSCVLSESCDGASFYTNEFIQNYCEYVWKKVRTKG